jgi:phytoene synthase
MSENLLAKYAKSFNWAGFFLPSNEYEKSLIVYNYCRTLDDIVDEDKGLYFNFYNKPSDEYRGLTPKEILQLYKTYWRTKNDFEPITKNMWKLFEKENISRKIVEDLFDGLESDLSKKIKIKTKKDLLIYCYRVAGTVGIMMAKVLQVKDKRALLGAIDLGIAMQLTNISRDVIEDGKKNREYIEPNFEEIKKNIYLADEFYDSSFSSIRKIPFRFRFAILVARRIYRQIGYKILKKKTMENYKKPGKIYVTNFGKIVQTVLSIYDLITLLFIKTQDHLKDKEHKIINEEINLNERI